jgi:hypothetical protein
VLRKAQGLEAVDTLAAVHTLTDTSFLDRALEPATAYEYWVAAVNDAGLSVPSLRVSTSGYSVQAVRLLPLEVDDEAGTITARWSRFVGPGFLAYQLNRREVGAGDDVQLVRLEAVADTSFIDDTAIHRTDYLYHVTVVEAAGQVLQSPVLAGGVALRAVADLDVMFDSRTASAALSWSAYSGPHFLRYEVQRRTGNENFTVIGRAVTLLPDETWNNSQISTGTKRRSRVEYNMALFSTSIDAEWVYKKKFGGIFHLPARHPQSQACK